MLLHKAAIRLPDQGTFQAKHGTKVVFPDIFCNLCVHVCLAEAELEAAELRTRGRELERLAQQRRAASRSQAADQLSRTDSALERKSSSQQKQALVQLQSDGQQQQQQHDIEQNVGQLGNAQEDEVVWQTTDAEQLQAQRPAQLQSDDHQLQHSPMQGDVASHNGTPQQQSPCPTGDPLDQETGHEAVATQPDVAHEPVCPQSLEQGTEQPSLSAEGGCKQGLVVWGLTKGWPAWPALVITEEEIEVADVQGSRKNLQKGVWSFWCLIAVGCTACSGTRHTAMHSGMQSYVQVDCLQTADVSLPCRKRLCK